MEHITDKLILTLDDAITHADEVAQRHRDQASVDAERSDHFAKSPVQCNKYADEHEQLAEWLRELKAYREIIYSADQKVLDIYGVLIPEGYSDVFSDLKEVFDKYNQKS